MWGGLEFPRSGRRVHWGVRRGGNLALGAQSASVALAVYRGSSLAVYAACRDFSARFVRVHISIYVLTILCA